MSTPNKRKAPAFQFYADDFLAGTLEMSQSDVGAYIRLLCHQWNRGSIPVEPEKQQRLAGGNVSVDVLAKFNECEDGLLRNQRLESVRCERNVFTQQQREKGLKSALARAKAKQRATEGATEQATAVEPEAQPNGQPDTQPEFNSPSPTNTKNTLKRSPWLVSFDVELPESMQTQNCLEAVKLWLEYKKERKEGYKATGLRAAVTKWSREFTPATFPIAVETSMANGWSGIFPPKDLPRAVVPSNETKAEREKRMLAEAMG